LGSVSPPGFPATPSPLVCPAAVAGPGAAPWALAGGATEATPELRTVGARTRAARARASSGPPHRARPRRTRRAPAPAPTPRSAALRRRADWPRVALTTDWLLSFGGAERVLAQLQHVYPGAPIHTTIYDPAGLPAECREWPVRPSFLQRLPLARRYHRALLPLMPLAIESFDLDAYDVVLTTASAFAKGVVTPPGVPNVCYCYTPPRYLWDQFHAQTRGMRGRLLVSVVASALRMWDRVAADRVDVFVAISETVAARIRRYYRRDALVVYPPVDTERFRPNGL